jgi:hypothetical protein
LLSLEPIQVRYSIPGFVEELQEGCNMLLMHWHYYNCRPYPQPDRPGEQKQSFLADLTDEQYKLVMDTMGQKEVQRHLDAFERYKNDNGASETTTTTTSMTGRL